MSPVPTANAGTLIIRQFVARKANERQAGACGDHRGPVVSIFIFALLSTRAVFAENGGVRQQQCPYIGRVGGAVSPVRSVPDGGWGDVRGRGKGDKVRPPTVNVNPRLTGGTI